MEWLSKLFDITKLPSKFFAWIALLAGCSLFLPARILALLQIDKLPTDYKPFIGAAFLASSAFLLINIAIWVWSKVVGWFRKRGDLAKMVLTLTELDSNEKAVLREFFIQGANVIELPIDHPTVTGLTRKGIVTYAGQNGYRGLAGSVFPCQLTSHAKRLITIDLLGLSMTPTEADIKAIREARPNYIAEIEKKDRWRGGSFWN
jgi:hypothetical protein